MIQLFKSPLNYIGNKYKLLPQLLPLFPKDIDIFVDLFCGGLDVSLNTTAKKKYCNDIEPHLIEFLKYCQSCTDGNDVHKQVLQIQDEYGLSRTNREGYLALRHDYNENPSVIKFYALISCSFNNQMRFNSEGHFNVPFGRRNYNPALQKRLPAFVERLTDEYIFTNQDFTDFNFSKCNLTPSSFVYIDSPYLISTAWYTENSNWKHADDVRLMRVVDRLNDKGIKFGMSNVMRHKGTVNVDLERWAQRYTVYVMEKDYSNCFYNKTDKSETQEVFICNY